MKKPRGRWLGLGILAGTLALCMALPTLLARGRDHALTGTIHTEEMEPITAEKEHAYTLPERLRLLDTSYMGSQPMELHTGTHFNSSTAREHVTGQIDALAACGLLPEDSSAYDACTITGVWFTADGDNPACSLMLWEMHTFSETSILNLQMDDETGKIIGFQLLRTESSVQTDDWPALDRAAASWGEYLALEIGAWSGPSPWLPDDSLAHPASEEEDMQLITVADQNAKAGYVLYAGANEFSIFPG